MSRAGSSPKSPRWTLRSASTCPFYSTAISSRLPRKQSASGIAKAQAEQDQLRAALDHVGGQLGQSAADLDEACREAFREARQSFAEAATDSDFNRLVEAAVGPMVLLADGTIAQKQTTALSDGRLAGSVAGGGFEPPTSGL